MDLKAQSPWSWGVDVYLFLVAVGTGAYVVGVLADFRGPEWQTLAHIGIFLSFPCCAVAGFVKLAQLGKPAVAWRAWMRPGTSWIARGTLLLFSFMLVSFIHLLLNLFGDGGVYHFLGIVGAVLAVSLMLYSGILLTAARPIAFWSTALLPILFLLSALVCGMMAIVLLGVIGGEPFEGPLGKLQQAVVAFLVLKALAILIYLQSTHRVGVARASVRMVLRGELAPLFWFGVVVAGLVLSTLFGALAVSASSAALAAIAAVFGLAGGLAIRQVVLGAGIHAPLRAGSFEVPLPIV